MISVFFGNDTTKVREKAFAFAHTLSSTPPTIITTDIYEEGMIPSIAEGVSLFEGAQVYVLDTLSEETDIFEHVLEKLESMAHSQNHFVIIETPLNAGEKKKIQTHATKVEEYTGEKAEKFNAFSLTDAFLRRDKKSLWLLLTEAWDGGLSNEEIIGVLFWQIKTLRLVEKTKSAEEAGQKPFVYQKAKRALGIFKKGELDSISRALLRIYHDGHLGKRDTTLALEKWVLTL